MAQNQSHHTHLSLQGRRKNKIWHIFHRLGEGAGLQITGALPTCICSAQSENRYNSRIVLRKVGILTLSGEVGILTLRSAIPELLVRKVGIGTK